MPASVPPSTPLDRAARDWLPLGAASRLLSVDPDTLRRWADAGRVDSWTTPGGHRRFARRSLERLVAAREAPARPSLARLGATPERLSAAYRRSYGHRTAGGPDARSAVEPPMREAFRRDGRHLVEALIRHLDELDPVERDRAEREAAELAAAFARRLGAEGTGFVDAVGLFVAARRPFLAELGSVARRRALGPGQLSALYEDASALLDRLLLGFIAAFGAGDSVDPPSRI